MKTVSVKLPTPLATWLTRQAKVLGRSQSDIIRESLEASKKGKSKPSCAELMGDLGGFFEGPSDLSTNPKYLDGFGK